MTPLAAVSHSPFLYEAKEGATVSTSLYTTLGSLCVNDISEDSQVQGELFVKPMFMVDVNLVIYWMDGLMG